MEQSSKMNLLSAKKQNELKAAIENAVASGVQYNLNYQKFSTFKVNIDNEAKKKAVNFLLGDMLELVELDFRMAPVVKALGDPSKKESLNYREFKLLQEIIKASRLKGRKNLIMLCDSMEAFNEDGQVCDQIEQESKIFIKAYQDASSVYAQLCKKFGILPDDLQNEIELKTEEELKKLSNN